MPATIGQFCCQNKVCPDSGKRGHGNLYFRGWSGRGKRIRMAHCRTCKRSCSERKSTAFERSRLPDDKAVSILEHLREGCGTRATGRLVGVNANTVTRYVTIAGGHAKALHDDLVEFPPLDARGPA
jgi:hypothetical protein